MRVTDEMVERAMKAFAMVAHDLSSDGYDADKADAELVPIGRKRLQKSRDAIRAALETALTSGEQ